MTFYIYIWGGSLPHRGEQSNPLQRASWHGFGSEEHSPDSYLELSFQSLSHSIVRKRAFFFFGLDHTWPNPNYDSKDLLVESLKASYLN